MKIARNIFFNGLVGFLCLEGKVNVTQMERAIMSNDMFEVYYQVQNVAWNLPELHESHVSSHDIRLKSWTFWDFWWCAPLAMGLSAGMVTNGEVGNKHTQKASNHWRCK